MVSVTEFLKQLQSVPLLDVGDAAFLERLRESQVYLAAPYKSDDREVVKYRVKTAGLAARQLVALGIPAFSPCTYTAQWQGDDLAGDFIPEGGWNALDVGFLKGCHAMIVLMLPGVENSSGVKIEFEYAREHGIPIYRMEVDDIIAP